MRVQSGQNRRVERESSHFLSAMIDIREDSREFAELLRDKGYVVAGGEAAESFGWTSWRATTDQLLEALFPLNAER